MKLTTKPEPVTLERTLKWWKKQVAPTAKMLLMSDAINGTDKVNESIEDAVLQPRHEKLLMVQSCDVADIVIG